MNQLHTDVSGDDGEEDKPKAYERENSVLANMMRLED